MSIRSTLFNLELVFIALVESEELGSTENFVVFLEIELFCWFKGLTYRTCRLSEMSLFYFGLAFSIVFGLVSDDWNFATSSSSTAKHCLSSDF